MNNPLALILAIVQGSVVPAKAVHKFSYLHSWKFQDSGFPQMVTFYCVYDGC